VPEPVRPRHVAIIADGNRRWARDRGLPVLAGHVQGIEAIRPIVRRARDAGVETLSVYTFSTENWTRPEDEVSGLFGLIDGAVRQYTDELVDENVRVRVIGRLHEAPADVQRSIRAAEERTQQGSGITLNICFNYSGRAEIIDAARALSTDALGLSGTDAQNPSLQTKPRSTARTRTFEDLGIEAVAGVTDGGGNHAAGNGNPAQCTNVDC